MGLCRNGVSPMAQPTGGQTVVFTSTSYKCHEVICARLLKGIRVGLGLRFSRLQHTVHVQCIKSM